MGAWKEGERDIGVTLGRGSGEGQHTGKQRGEYVVIFTHKGHRRKLEDKEFRDEVATR